MGYPANKSLELTAERLSVSVEDYLRRSTWSLAGFVLGGVSSLELLVKYLKLKAQHSFN